MPVGEVLFAADEIQQRVAELAAAIRQDYAQHPPAIVAILSGSFVFLADLLRHLDHQVTVDLVEASSYGRGTESSGHVILRRPGRLDVAGRDVLVVDDIADTGHTLAAVCRALNAMEPRSVRTCVLLDKPGRRVVPVALHYRGFQVDEGFVVGYGLDHAGRYRGLPYIARLR